MEIYDICMLVVLVGATLFGAYKGMAWQVASTASFVLSYMAALRFSEQLAPRFGQQAPLNRFIAMFVLYMATSLAIWLMFRAVANIINRVRLREFDRQMGALFGAAKGVLWCVAITFFAVTLSEQARTAVLHSRSGYMIAQLLDQAHGVMPRELHGVLEPYLNRLERGLDPNQNPDPPEAAEPVRQALRQSFHESLPPLGQQPATHDAAQPRRLPDLERMTLPERLPISGGVVPR